MSDEPGAWHELVRHEACSPRSSPNFTSAPLRTWPPALPPEHSEESAGSPENATLEHSEGFLEVVNPEPVSQDAAAVVGMTEKPEDPLPRAEPQSIFGTKPE